MKFSASTKAPPIGAILTASCLNVKDWEWADKTCLQVTPDLVLSSSTAISRYLVRLKPSNNLIPNDVLQQTEVDHWLTFCVGPLSCKREFPGALSYLNTALGNSMYLVGQNLTVADLNVFGQILANEDWSDLSKEKNLPPNVGRWYRNLQSLKEVQSVFKELAKIGSNKGRSKEASPSTNQESNVMGRKEEGKFVELPGAEMGKVVVRFPPEASGYLHIGHAKAALLNWHYRELFNGQLIMRFDDTNPDKEKVDFEKVILEDLKLLEIKPDRFTHTSDHFPLLLSLCEQMLKSGDAYVDDTPAEQMKAEREARQASLNRANSVEKNMQLWKEMMNGSEAGQKCCVRAKINMAADNGCMRDPTIYRCKNEPHPRTQAKYKVYPTYDFACPIVDSVEGVTHALRTMEYHDRDEQFYWFCDKLKIRKPVIWEYSRLNMMNTVLSKRKLTWFVDQGLVDSWEDPRFPTVRGVIRRGMTVQGLKQFIIAQGSSRSVVQMEWDKIWAINKKVIDPVAPRFTALLADSLVTVNVADASPSKLTVAKHPKNPEVGTKTINTGPTIFIEAADANSLKEGENATFINWGNLNITKLHRNDEGNVVKVDAKLNLSNIDFKKTLKLTWLAKSGDPLTSIDVIYYDHIITKAVLAKDEDFKTYINKDSKKVVKYVGDLELSSLQVGEIIQLQRIGFFKVDKASSSGNPIVLIHIPDGSTKPPSQSIKPSTAKDSNVSRTPLTSTDLEQIADQWRNDRLSQLPAQNKPSNTADLSNKISQQGDKVRQLKSEKGSKADIDEAVKVLLSLKKEYKTATGSEWKPGAPVSAAPPSTASTTNAADLSSKIADQGNKVRELKSSKAAKNTIDEAVKLLLSLKQEYKTATGSDWKPESTPVAVPPSVPSTASGTNSSDLSSKVAEQGDKVRQLKAEKAAKSAIDEAVKVLLSLKQEYKAATGTDWKPSATGSAPVAIPVSPSTAVSNTSAADLSSKVATQGDKVRQLKSEKAAKSAIDEAVKVLLSLKQEYKAATGSDWTPSATPVMASSTKPADVSAVTASAAAGDLNSRITEQGDKVRKLKSEKASKSEVDAAVKVLLGLKAEFKSAHGIDWAPNMATPTPPNASNTTTPSEASNSPADALSQAIQLVGDKVRQLKSEKASAAVIDEAVKELLKLKADFKALTGSDWQPAGGQPARRQQKDKSATAKKPPAPKEKKTKDVKEASGDGDEKALKKQTRLGLEATKEDNLPDWYSQVITKGEMIEYYDVSGCYILRPWAFAVWEAIQSFLDKEIKKLGVVNAYFPMFVSRSVLEREKAHIADFAPEVAWVTRSGDSELAEHIAIRPTSETAMYPAYSKWIQSHRDLPMRLNQWNNVVRWEFKHPQPFLRTREFLWQEGHTAFATYKEAEEEVYQILDLYARVYTDLLAIPVVKGRKTEKEKFAGGDYTTTVEAFISASGRGIQGATSHHLGHNFAKMFDIVVEDPETKEKMYVYQNSWGLTTRTIGVMIMVHADNQGLVMPPAVSALQAVIVPCGITATLAEPTKISLVNACKDLDRQLKAADIRSKLDERDNYSPGWKFNHWELKGVPVRIELGPKDLEKSQMVAVRRDNGQKVTLPLANAAQEISRLLTTVQSSLYAAAEADLKSHTKLVSKWEDFCTKLDEKNILLAPFCEEIACEENIKRDSARDQDLEPGAPAMGAKSLCIPLEQPAAIKPGDKCIHPSCQKPAKSYTLFGRSY